MVCRKPTNKLNFNNKKCDRTGTCGNMITSKDNNKGKHKQDVSITIGSRLDRYRVPSSLIYDLFENKF